MNFDNVIGQTEVITSLIHSIENDQVGHAYIFSGTKGIGKKMVAEAFARSLLCSSPNQAGNCGECLACRLFEENTNPDFQHIDPDGNSISIDEIRNIQSHIIIKPLYSNRKVYLIADADRMTTQAQNCLLKTLEEPPAYATIILTTANYDALMETIRSRAIRYSFKKNTDEEVRKYLETKLGGKPREIDFIISYANGVIGTAVELADSEEFISLREKTLDLLLRLRKSQLVEIFDIYSFFETNKNHIDVILDIMMLFYRDILVAKNTGKQNILINSDKKDIILNNMALYSMEKLLKNIDIVGLTRKQLKQNANFQLAIEVMLMKLQEEG